VRGQLRASLGHSSRIPRFRPALTTHHDFSVDHIGPKPLSVVDHNERDVSIAHSLSHRISNQLGSSWVKMCRGFIEQQQ
jgi:hypothetical protein